MYNKKTYITFHMHRAIIIIAFLNLFLSFSLNIFAADTFYMPDDFANLHAAFEGMNGGDTLIIRDGTYTGDDNILDSWHYPPSGSSGAYTIVKSENTGKVIFDGENTRWMFYKNGSTSGKMQYVQFEGIEWKNSTAEVVFLAQVDHIKFLKCGFAEASTDKDSFYTHTCDYILLENCYSFGNARYHFHYYHSNNSVMRLCVARHDKGHWVYQQGFQIYQSNNIAIQNCIVVDSDQPSYYNNASQLYAFINPNNSVTGDNCTFEGCIAIKNDMNLAYIGALYTNTLFKNVLSWDNVRSGRNAYIRGQGTFNHITMGNTVQSNTEGFGGDGVKEVTNSIVYNISGDALATGGGSFTDSYLCLYGNISNGIATVGVDDITNVDILDGDPGNGTPALKYLVRIEPGSDLDGAASDSEDIGATILKRVGKSGTLWGEPGYNLLQDGTSEQADVSLWPFPNEDIIRTAMRAYTYDDGSGGDPEITGARGFCADGQTLTNYIWGYLRNTVPPFNLR